VRIDFVVYAQFMARWTRAEQARLAELERGHTLTQCPFVDAILSGVITDPLQASAIKMREDRIAADASHGSAIERYTYRGGRLQVSPDSVLWGELVVAGTI
jgi:hypothetical protein